VRALDDNFYVVARTSSIPKRRTTDVDALRHFRTHAQWDNWARDLRTEIYQLIYRESVYPPNLHAERAPFTHAEFREQVIDRQIQLMVERGVWVAPDRRD
jgi:hypothetical protein